MHRQLQAIILACVFLYGCSNREEEEYNHIVDTITGVTQEICRPVNHFDTGDTVSYEILTGEGKSRNIELTVERNSAKWVTLSVYENQADYLVHIPQGCGPFDTDTQFKERNRFNNYFEDYILAQIVDRLSGAINENSEIDYELSGPLVCSDLTTSAIIAGQIIETESCSQEYINSNQNRYVVHSQFSNLNNSSELWLIEQVHVDSNRGQFLQIRLIYQNINS